MANKYDLKTWAKTNLTAAVSTSGTNIGSGAVASGKTRFLTYIRVQRTGVAITSNVVASLLIGVGSVNTGSPDPSHVLAATYLKMPIHLLAASKTKGLGMVDQVYVQELRGSIEHPILSVGGGGYMGIAASLTAGKTADVVAQYFDE